MAQEINRKIVEIDATDQAVGRVATQVSMALQGKNKADYQQYLDGGDIVVVKNAGKVKFTGRKLAQKDYYHHTMYPGGLKTTSMKKVFERDPADVMKRAVFGMLPKNKVRDKMIKRLTINV